MNRRSFVCGILLMIIAGYWCAPGRRDLFDFDCDSQLNCTDTDEKPVCGSDGVTYTNKCYLQLEHQRQNCEVGNFNLIQVVHEGNCTVSGDNDGSDGGVSGNGSGDGGNVNTIISVHSSG